MAKSKLKGRANQGGSTRWKKGQPSANPKGRPKGSKNKFSIAALQASIKQVEYVKQKSFMAAWIEAAWGDATAMSNIANYMLPHLRSIEGVVATFDASMSDDLAKDIQDKLRERYIQK